MVTLDTNVAIYALTAEPAKASRAQATLVQSDFVSVQVLNETANVLVRKRRLPWSVVTAKLDQLHRAVAVVVQMTEAHHRAATRVAQRYQLQFYDALLIAVALANGATTLYTEDMQDDLVIDDRLRIENPFA